MNCRKVQKAKKGATPGNKVKWRTKRKEKLRTEQFSK